MEMKGKEGVEMEDEKKTEIEECLWRHLKVRKAMNKEEALLSIESFR